MDPREERRTFHATNSVDKELHHHHPGHRHQRHRRGGHELCPRLCGLRHHRQHPGHGPVHCRLGPAPGPAAGAAVPLSGQLPPQAGDRGAGLPAGGDLPAGGVVSGGPHLRPGTVYRCIPGSQHHRRGVLPGLYQPLPQFDPPGLRPEGLHGLWNALPHGYCCDDAGGQRPL